jgi:hypothetical protein
MRGILVRAIPLALFAALCEWIAFDLVRHGTPQTWAVGALVLVAAAFAAIVGSWRVRSSWHRAARGILATAFIGERLLVAGVDVVPMLGFIVLLIVLGSLEALERTFGPVYDAVRDPALLAKVDDAATSGYARALGLAGFTFAVSLLLVQVVPILALQGRTLILALALAFALLAVIAWLALSPSWPSRRKA